MPLRIVNYSYCRNRLSLGGGGGWLRKGGDNFCLAFHESYPSTCWGSSTGAFLFIVPGKFRGEVMFKVWQVNSKQDIYFEKTAICLYFVRFKTEFIFDIPFILYVLGLKGNSFLQCHKEEIIFVIMQNIFSFKLFFEDPGLDHNLKVTDPDFTCE